MKALVIALALVTGCAAAGQHYGLGYSVSNGAALVPPTASRGTTTAIVYHEQGGVVARGILILLAAAALQNPEGDTTTKTRQYREGDYLITETTTTFTPTTPAEKARREQAIADFNNEVLPGLTQSELPVEVDIGFARRSLGGDTAGGNFDMLYQMPLTPYTAVSAGFGFASYTFQNRAIHDVTLAGNTLTSTVKMGDLNYGFIGFPVKVTHSIANHLSGFFQWDLNVKSLTDNDASPITFGALFQVPVLTIKAFAITDRFDIGAMTFGLEGIVGF